MAGSGLSVSARNEPSTGPCFVPFSAAKQHLSAVHSSASAPSGACRAGQCTQVTRWVCVCGGRLPRATDVLQHVQLTVMEARKHLGVTQAPLAKSCQGLLSAPAPRQRRAWRPESGGRQCNANNMLACQRVVCTSTMPHMSHKHNMFDSPAVKQVDAGELWAHL